MKRTQGFTLIELMVVVAIVAIISSIAYPAYSSYVVRSKLSEVGSALSNARLSQEQFFADSRNYGVAGGACGAAMPNLLYFSFACVTGAPNSTYIITASSKAGAGLGAVNDYVYTVNQLGTKATTKFKGATVAIADWKHN